MTKNSTIEALKKEMHLRTGNPFYEREISEILELSKILLGCKSFVDAGASLGPYTWSANLILKNATITAIEANPILCEHLKKQWVDIEDTGLSSGNKLEVVNAALSNETDTLDFFINKGNYLNSYIGTVMESPDHSDTHDRIELPALSLDTMFPEEPPDFIKIDIEGAEWRALKGASKLINQRKTRFLIEIHPWGDASMNKRPSDVFRFMSSADYKATRLSQHWLFTPEKPSLAERAIARFYGFILDHPSLRKLAKSLLTRH